MRFEFSEVPRLVLPAIFALLLALGSCGDSLLDVEFKNDPMGNFDALWSEFDRYYALFDVRLVNWDSLYAVYRPTVHKGLDDRELFLAMKGLLAPLRDRHVSLSIPDGLFFNSGSVDGKALFPDSHPSMNNIDRRMLIRKSLGTYLDSVFVSSTEYGLPGDFSWYGTIAPTHTDSKLGYLLVAHFRVENVNAYLGAVANAFRDHHGVIVDLRASSGGYASAHSTFSNLFADTRRVYGYSRYRNGPRHGDLSGPEKAVLSPANNTLAGIPLAFLGSPVTVSAGERVIMGARALPLATIIGDTTAGCLGGRADKVLPNGWHFTLSPELFCAPDGTCYEGTGIPPDVRAVATKAGVYAGEDAAIDRAIELLESASRRRMPHRNSVSTGLRSPQRI